jgi:hypothetical protein
MSVYTNDRMQYKLAILELAKKKLYTPNYVYGDGQQTSFICVAIEYAVNDLIRSSNAHSVKLSEYGDTLREWVMKTIYPYDTVSEYLYNNPRANACPWTWEDIQDIRHNMVDRMIELVKAGEL